MKKLVNSLLIIVILIFCIAGCSSNEDILAKKSQSNVEEQSIITNFRNYYGLFHLFFINEQK